MIDLFKHFERLREVQEDGVVNLLPKKKIILKPRTENILSTWVDKTVNRPKGEITIPSTTAALPNVTRYFELLRCARNSRFGYEDQYPEILNFDPNNKLKTNLGTMTELEYFSKVIGADLDPRNEKNNWWEGWPSSPTTGAKKKDKVVVRLSNEDRVFDLSKPLDNIYVRILLLNPDYIAESFETRDALQSYLYYMVDENAEGDVRKEKIDLNIKSIGLLDEILKSSDKKEQLLQIFVVQDPNMKYTYSSDLGQLETVAKYLAFENPKQFIELCNTSNKDKRLAIFFAARKGEDIKKRGERYETVGGEIIGNIYDVIERMQKDNEFNNRIEYALVQQRNSIAEVTVETPGKKPKNK